MEQRSVPSPIGTLLVGAGFIAEVHAAAVTASARAHLAGVVDADPGRAAAFARSHGAVPHTDDLAEALAWPDVDAVVVCTPNHTHLGIGAAVAAAGKHLLIEKPLATTVADAQALADAFAKAGRVLTAAHSHRHHGYGRTVKDAIDAGAVGTPAHVRLAILGGWIWTGWDAWAADPVVSGGHALHNGVHVLDLATWWLSGDPVRVRARGRRQTAAELRIYDYLEMVVEYAGGAVAVCEMSRAHRPGSFGLRELRVVGSAGIIDEEWADESAFLFTEAGTKLVPAAGVDGFGAQFESWLDTIEGAPPAMSVADAVRAVELAVAVEESIESGRPVELGAAA
ncbi:Gfo/Idh/MocA family protein [Actinophytocola sp.]|uniref:Gfo/Idh/MocA family protein n=1 Tax=Actinophytocola sp. TaxID=1872138 RepID=UPI003899AADD